MKIAFITTIDTNIGDDFIRIGIENLIASVNKHQPAKYTYRNKHLPETSLLSNSPLHVINRLPQVRGKQRLINWYYKYFNHYFTVYKNHDLIIQSGAPVLWPDCHLSEWTQPIWYDTIGKLYEKIPVINLAAGSCYPWENQKGFMNEQESVFAKDIGTFCKLTTARDRMANRLFLEVGIDNVLLPCTALMVNSTFENPDSGKYIIVNYMEGGGHFDWNQNVDKSAWEQTMKKLTSELSKNHDVRFICHNKKEFLQAEKLFPGFKIHYPKNVADYIEIARNALVGINNRMHATMAMASLGIPSVSIGTDTRLLMPDLIGLPIYYVKEADYVQLHQVILSLIEKHSSEKKNLLELKRTTSSQYQNLLKPYVK